VSELEAEVDILSTILSTRFGSLDLTRPYTVPRDGGKIQNLVGPKNFFISLFLLSLYILLMENHRYGVRGCKRIYFDLCSLYPLYRLFLAISIVMRWG
jgi:hypothetical protein